MMDYKYVLIAILIILLIRNCKIYHLKIIFCNVYLLFACIVFLPIGLYRRKDVTNLIVASDLCRPICKIIGVEWQVEGKENLGEDKSCVFVANHQSGLDILGMFELWPIMKRCTVVAKRELLYFGLFGISAWLCGLIFIKRGGKAETTSMLESEMRKLNENKIKLWMFPEGTRRCTGKIHEFKKGAFHLAVKEQVPIVPVVFSRYYLLDATVPKFDPGKVIIKALPAISTEGKTTEDIDELIELTRKQMQAAFDDITKQTTFSS